MSEEKQEKKRYWIKIEKSFLDSKYIKIIKKLPNGTDYVLFYLALMLESVETVGHLKLSELVPYNEDTLASLTDTNIDIVRSALKLFKDLGMVEFLTDGTIFLPDVPRLTGSESLSAERVRNYRTRKRLTHDDPLSLQCNNIGAQSNPIKEKDIQEEIQENKQENKYENKQAREQACLLYSLHRQIDTGFQRTENQLDKWADDIDKIHRIDGRSWEDIEKVIRWAKDDKFWRDNIISGAKLRQRFDQLIIKVNRTKAEVDYSKVEGIDD